MKTNKKVEYEGKDLDNNFCFTDGVIEYKYSRKQIENISETNYFNDEIIYELIIENEITVKINPTKEQVKRIERKDKKGSASQLIEKIELRETIKKHLKLGNNIQELIERLAELQGEDETIKFIEKAKMENKVEIKEYAKENGVNKTLYLVFCFILGGFGVHKFYVKRYVQGVFYLIFCWTWIPVIISLIEGVMAIREPADENGRVYFEK